MACKAAFLLHISWLGQRKDKLRAHTFGADHIDVFTVGLDDVFYDRKAKAGTFFIFTSGKIRFVETAPDLFDTFFRNSDTGIFDGNENTLKFQVGLDVDHRIRMAELDGIVDQVVEHLLDLAQIRIDHLCVVGKSQIQNDVLRAAGSFKGCCGVFDDTVDIEIAAG